MELRAIKTYFQDGQTITVEDDVLHVVQDIKTISDRLTVEYDWHTGKFHIIELCRDGTERLVFSVDELDARVPLRLRAADHWRGNDVPAHVLPDDQDAFQQMEDDNDALKGQIAAADRERIADAGERIGRALDYDGKGVQAQISVSKDI